MNAQQNIGFTSPFVGFVSVVSEIIAPIATAIGSVILRGFEYMANRRAASQGATAFVAQQAYPAPHVALMMVQSNFITEPFKKY
jgi:hypothetical protein